MKNSEKFKPGDNLSNNNLTAPPGKIRVVKSNLSSGPEIFVRDYSNKVKAIKFVNSKNEESENDEDFEYSAYDDKGRTIA